MNRLSTIDETYKRLLTRLYEDQNPAQARALAGQLQRLLVSVNEDEVGSIFAEECKSLISEAHGELPDAIKHREAEIRLILRLHEISADSDSRDFVHSQYDYEDLRDRLYLLASLYHDAGNLEKAIVALKQAQQLCERRKLEFDWIDVLAEYSNEQTINIRSYLSISENGTLCVEEAMTGQKAMQKLAFVSLNDVVGSVQ